MECESARETMNALIDRQLPPGEAAALESHLAICQDCRQAAEQLRAQDAELLRALQPQRVAAQRVADGVLSSLYSGPRVSHQRPSGSRWTHLLLAAAAGFLLAVFVFRPWQQRPVTVTLPPEVIHPPQDPPPVATLVAATGDVEIRAGGAGEWAACTSPSAVKTFLCPSDSVVRTGPNVRCELKTADGCVVRLNEESEVTFTSSNSLEIQRGQIWCSSPDNVALKILAGDAHAKTAPPAWSAGCTSSSCMMTAVGRDGGVQVTSAQGEADLQAAQGSERLLPGESAEIVAGRIVKSPRTVDPHLATSWMHPLLIRKGHADQELADQVNGLLARLGQTKVALLYEQEIRGLGEYAALPLLRYVQSPLSRQEPARRGEAVRLLSDLAPSWMVGELIELLSDDADTRFLAASALQRLTGLDQGRKPDRWREDLGECRPAIELWQEWWAANRGQYPARVGVGVNSS